MFGGPLTRTTTRPIGPIMAAGGYIAVDWGTSNRRVYLLSANGGPIATIHDDRGVLAIAKDGFAAEFATMRQRHGPLPIYAAGMIGSSLGLRDIPYVAAPVGLGDLAAATVHCPDGVLLVPGVSFREQDRADVMRGEEVQVFGAIAARLAPPDALFCQPGTHAKWINTVSGRIVRFATALTGEVFALLRTQGALAEMLGGPAIDGPAFRRGIERGAGCRDLLDALFGVRAAVLLGALAREDAAAFASGILIGADVGTRGDLTARPVHLLASGTLADLYAAAIAACGGTTIRIDSDAAFVAGIHAIREATP